MKTPYSLAALAAIPGLTVEEGVGIVTFSFEGDPPTVTVAELKDGELSLFPERSSGHRQLKAAMGL